MFRDYGFGLPSTSMVFPGVFQSIDIVLQNALGIKSCFNFQVVRKISPRLSDNFPLAAFFMVLCYLGPYQEIESVFHFGFPFTRVPVI